MLIVDHISFERLFQALGDNKKLNLHVHGRGGGSLLGLLQGPIQGDSGGDIPPPRIFWSIAIPPTPSHRIRDKKKGEKG